MDQKTTFPEPGPAVVPGGLKQGDQLLAKFGRWYQVTVLEVGEGSVKIRWNGWGSNWDEVKPIKDLRQLPAPK